ncbi:MAG: tripartite tricarboxylate transporter substrate binding protein [Deltaproteobacteria bacterium]|nr:tripartite tricarboxylate transporter substrate binding protein [Deltaproteobacteria bacterium]
MNSLRKLLTTTMAAIFVLVTFAGGTAQAEYPEKPVKVIVPYAAGGFTDSTVRVIQKGLTKTLPQPMVVINVPGGGAVIGARQAKDLPADGYNLLVHIVALITTRVMGVSDFGTEAFEPIAQTGTNDMMICVAKKSPYKTLDDLVAAAKAKPKTLREAVNIGAIVHFLSLMFCDAAGDMQVRYVQTGGGAKRLASILGGHADYCILGTTEAKATYESGDIRVLAVLADKRSRFYPDVPTAKELGYGAPYFGMDLWWFAPKGTPLDRIKVMETALAKAVEIPEVSDSLQARAMEVAYMDRAQLTQKLANIKQMVEALAKKKNISLKKKK